MIYREATDSTHDEYEKSIAALRHHRQSLADATSDIERLTTMIREMAGPKECGVLQG